MNIKNPSLYHVIFFYILKRMLFKLKFTSERHIDQTPVTHPASKKLIFSVEKTNIVMNGMYGQHSPDLYLKTCITDHVLPETYVNLMRRTLVCPE